MRCRLLSLTLALAAPAASANSDWLSGIAAPDSAAIGAARRFEQSPYRGAGSGTDFLPLYLYEGERFYMHSYAAGAKFGELSSGRRFDLFLRYRFEGYPNDRVPESLAGMRPRESGIDAGFSAQAGGGWGIAYAELLHDISEISRGSELRLGYKYPLRRGRLWLQPQAMLGFRDANLNNYYYGVRPDEATPLRPAYSARGGAVTQLGLYGAYRLTERWRLIGGVTWVRWPDVVALSPVVETRVQRGVTLGLMYDISPDHRAWPEHGPLIARAYYGASSDCNVTHIMRLVCTSTHTRDQTSIAALEVGRPFIERLNGWPLDFAGFVGLARHKEAGFQPDFYQINAYIKAYYYGFPWDSHVRTRVGLGIGLAYARRIPLMEVRDLADRGRPTSRLLNTFDPTVDVSVGDLLGARSLRDTYVGLGVAHRSGIFGSSRLLGNVSGGSNYIYGYVETTF